MRRAAFLMLGVSPLLCARIVRAQSDADPASWSRKPALRVLLGPGIATTASAELFNFDGRVYRGTFQRLNDGQIVNVVDLEAYLYSVVSREMSVGWPPSALEAQSICARTYVLQRSDPRRPYDLVPSELDQIYDGLAAESPSSVAAVDTTTGQVLKFGGVFARVAYSSCCGGHTEASSDAWGGTALPYLEGVVCTSCTASPHYRWTAAIPLDALATRFAPALAPLGELVDVRITDRDPSGRARAFELLAARGSSIVAAGAFRRALGTRALPSLLVTKLTRTADQMGFEVEGGGLGHGVGLCQWGARGMALDGRAAPEILAFYFPGATVDDLNR